MASLTAVMALLIGGSSLGAGTAAASSGTSAAAPVAVPPAKAPISASCTGVSPNTGRGAAETSFNIGSGPWTIDQPFARWGDTNDYFQVYGGTVEFSFMWSVTGRAWLTAENEPWKVNARLNAGDYFSMQVPSGSSARTVAYSMFFNDDVRFFMKSPGLAGSKLKFHIESSSGLRSNYLSPLASCDYVFDGSTTGWAPSTALPIPKAMGSVGFQMLSMKVSVSGGGSWLVDDIMQDPLRRVR